jgi:ferric-dicitrate binding protein FerR (iron transport regulator)
MGRTKKETKSASRIQYCCLILLVSLPIFKVHANTHLVGKFTQISGEVTFFNFTGLRKVSTISDKDILTTQGSYLTQDDSYFTANLNNEGWLRLSPRSKVALEYDPDSKTLKISLFTGSLKLLISSTDKMSFLNRVIVQSAGALFEAVDAKFTVSRNNLEDTSSAYVEKGAVLATQYIQYEKKDSEILHSNETTTINDRVEDINSPRKMTNKEIKFLHPSQYLKNSKTNF